MQSFVPQTTSTPNTYSGLFGVGQFPFHTDLAHWPEPPRYVLLRCIKGYEELPTLLADGKSLLRDITPDILGRAIVRPRRRVRGHSRLLRLLQSQTDGEALLRWDEVFLKPASTVGELACAAVKATRLAFADLLLDKGAPVSLILDDPLVYSDDSRFELMTDILTKAGERMQVILFTCRAKAFRHVAGNRISLANE